jgi:hypothetical protein
MWLLLAQGPEKGLKLYLIHVSKFHVSKFPSMKILQNLNLVLLLFS